MGGGRGSTSELFIDGVTALMTNNNPGVSDRLYEPQVDAVEEFSVQVNSLAAEYGRFSGGMMNVVTKSGTNQLHGSAYEFLQNSKLNANDFFANRAGRGRVASNATNTVVRLAARLFCRKFMTVTTGRSFLPVSKALTTAA